MQWIFVRHRDRFTWEIPAGHIEPDEKPEAAARRELYEECGVLQADLLELSDYEVCTNEGSEFGRLYLARVKERGKLPEFENAELLLTNELPDKLTYQEVQKTLFQCLQMSLRS